MFVQDMQLAQPPRTACQRQQAANDAHDEGVKCVLSVAAIIPRERAEKVSQMDLNRAFASQLPGCEEVNGVQAMVSVHLQTDSVCGSTVLNKT
jgi:hypothetical protein